MDTLSLTKEARIYNGKKTTIFKDFYISRITYISQGRSQSLRPLITLASRPAELQTNCGNLHSLIFDKSQTKTFVLVTFCGYQVFSSWLSSFLLSHPSSYHFPKTANSSAKLTILRSSLLIFFFFGLFVYFNLSHLGHLIIHCITKSLIYSDFCFPFCSVFLVFLIRWFGLIKQVSITSG